MNLGYPRAASGASLNSPSHTRSLMIKPSKKYAEWRVLAFLFYIIYTSRFHVPNCRIKCPASSHDRSFNPRNFSISIEVEVHQAISESSTKNGLTSPPKVKHQV